MTTRSLVFLAFALLVSSLVISCKSTRQIDGAPVEEEAPGAKNKPIETSPSTTGQGIRGQVFWVEGNRMPQANVSGEPATHPPKKKPVQRTVRIHKLTHLNEASLGDYLFGDIETTLVAEIQTDESGFFEVRLPPGSYSLFTVEEKGYFANVFDLDSYVHPVTVKRNAWKTTQITIDYMASY